MFTLLAVLVLATPAPTPTPPPEILHVVVSPVCATLQKTVVPVARVERRNDDTFQTAYTNIQDLSGKIIGLDDSGRLTKLTYLAHQTQQNVGTVFAAIESAERVLNDSRRRYPDAEYPQVAELRDHLNDVLELQRKYTFMLDSASGAFLDNQGAAAIYGGFQADPESVSKQDVLSRENYINGMRALFGQAPIDLSPLGTDQASEDTKRIQNEQAGLGLKIKGPDGTELDPVGVRAALHSAEVDLAKNVVSAVRSCH